jgi:hypothetical protein
MVVAIISTVIAMAVDKRVCSKILLTFSCSSNKGFDPY